MPSGDAPYAAAAACQAPPPWATMAAAWSQYMTHCMDHHGVYASHVLLPRLALHQKNISFRLLA